MPSDPWMDTFLMIGKYFRDSSTRKNVAKSNEANRNVVGYNHVDVLAVLTPDTYNENIITSGFEDSLRNTVVECALYNCSLQSGATIILHNGNRELERYVASSLPNSVINNRSYKQFDPLKGFEFMDMVQVLKDVGEKRHNLQPEFQSLLQVIYDLKPKGATTLSFEALVKCPVFNLSTILQERLARNLITMDNYNRLNALLLNGQSECTKLSNLLQELNNRLSHLIGYNGNTQSILSAIKSKMVMTLDMQSSTNQMELDYILSSIIIAANKGYNVTLVMDDVANVNSEQYAKIVAAHSSNFNCVISSKDFSSLLNHDEKLFSSAVGTATKVFLFRHQSNLSCEKWAKYLGEYEKKDISNNTGGTLGGFGFSMNDGMTVSNKREYRIRPEEIMGLEQGQAIIYDAVSNELMYTTEIA